MITTADPSETGRGAKIRDLEAVQDVVARAERRPYTIRMTPAEKEAAARFGDGSLAAGVRALASGGGRVLEGIENGFAITEARPGPAATRYTRRLEACKRRYLAGEAPSMVGAAVDRAGDDYVHDLAVASAAAQGDYRGFDLPAYLARALEGRGQRGIEEEIIEGMGDPPASVTRQLGAGRHVPVPAAAITLAETYSEAANWRTGDWRRDMFIPTFWPASVLGRAGATRIMTDDDVVFPRVSTAPTATMEAETASPADSGIAISTGRSTPKKASSGNDVNNMALVAADGRGLALVIPEMQAAVASRIEQQALTGSGASNNCRGIVNVTGVHTVAVAGTTPTALELLELPRQIADEDIPTGEVVFVAPPDARRSMRDVLGRAYSSPPMMPGQPMNEYAVDCYRGLESRHMPQNLGAANNESVIVAGNWMYLALVVYRMAFLTIDDVSLATSAKTRVTLHVFIDVVARLPGAFSKMQWVAA